jgi:rubrerythrin
VSEVACPNCGKGVAAGNGASAPLECPFCFEEFDPSAAAPAGAKGAERVSGLTLTYQINQQRIEVPAAEKTILGRGSFGANVLANILFNGKQVISRRHCSIEFRENKFYLKDEGSLNGTFYGANRADCKREAQVIENGGLVYMGEELFLARIRFAEDVARGGDDIAPRPAPARKYRCNEPNCGFESEKPETVCPACKTFNSLIEIYE